MKENTKNTIKQCEVKGDFTYAKPTDMQLLQAETVLGVTIPNQYCSFLKEYGHGGIGGIEILGIGKNGVAVFVTETIKYREYGLPDNFIVIENCDEWVYCINCDDASIVSWTIDSIENAYASFDEYIDDRFNDAAENL